MFRQQTLKLIELWRALTGDDLKVAFVNFSTLS
jgi:hypothetical protein